MGDVLSEEAFIARLASQVDAAGGGREGVESIGDDGAQLRVSDGRVIATDTMVEQVHFFADACPSDVAFKLLATNISDLHAMGALPRAWTLSVAAPALDAAWTDALIRGFVEARAALAPDLALVGGDTTRSPGPVVLSATLVGACARRRGGRLQPLERGGARAGTRVWVRGALGWAAGGLELYRRDAAGQPALPLPPDVSAFAERARAAHRRPLPPSAEPRAWSQLDAGLDVSDGLAKDLGRLARASGVGIELDAAAIADAELEALGAALGVDAQRWALHGGDDYALVGAAPAQPGPEWRAIGRVTRAEATLTLSHPDGSREALRDAGFEHFGAASSPHPSPTPSP